MIIDELDYAYAQEGVKAGQIKRIAVNSRTEGDSATEANRSRLRDELTLAFRDVEALLDELCGTGASRWHRLTVGKTPTYSETPRGSDLGYKWSGGAGIFRYASLEAGYHQYTRGHMTLRLYVDIGRADNIRFLKRLLTLGGFRWTTAARANAERAIELAKNVQPHGFDAWLKRLGHSK